MAIFLVEKVYLELSMSGKFIENKVTPDYNKFVSAGKMEDAFKKLGLKPLPARFPSGTALLPADFDNAEQRFGADLDRISIIPVYRIVPLQELTKPLTACS